MIKEIVFKKVLNEDKEIINLAMDLYVSENLEGQKKVPTVVLVHGGALKYGNDKTQSYIVEIAKHLSQNGYRCFSVDYRIRREPEKDYKGSLEDAVEDLNDALNWIAENEQLNGIDTERMALIGGSAGGWVSNNLFFLKNELPSLNKIKAFINLWGSPSQEQSLGGIGKSYPPSLVIHGTGDKIVPFNQTLELENKLRKSFKEVRVVPFEGDDHTPVHRMDEILDMIKSFLKENI